MTANDFEAAADMLCDARRGGTLLDGLGDLTPQDMAQGYALQDAFIGRWGDRIGGWKVGATAQKVQQVYGVSEPFSGPFYEATTSASPSAPAAGDFGHHCIESEFAFRFGKDLPPRGERYLREDILSAVESVMPAFELISPRFTTLLQDRVALAAADCGLNGGFVLGEETADWQAIDYENHAVKFRVGGEIAAEGTGANVLGHPFNVLDWLVNHLSARGIMLHAGEIVSTGTCTGFHYIEPGQRAEADFGALGNIEVTFV